MYTRKLRCMLMHPTYSKVARDKRVEEACNFSISARLHPETQRSTFEPYIYIQYTHCLVTRM